MALPNWLLENRAYLDHVPFLGMMVGQRMHDRPLITRTIENLVTAAISAGLVLYANDKVQDFKLTTIQDTVREHRTETRAEIAELRAAVAALHIAVLRHDTK
jgi:hypothetical protein